MKAAISRINFSNPPFQLFWPLRNAEKIFIIVFLTLNVNGVFFPPESYFSPQDYSLDAAPQEVGVPFGRYFVIVVILGLGILFLKYKKLMIRAVVRCGLPIFFVLWMCVTSFFTVDPGGAINRGIRTLVIVFFAAYLSERVDTPKILKFSLVAGAISILASVFAVYALPEYGVTHLIGYEGAWRGAAIHKNTLGYTMAILVIMSFYHLFFLRDWSGRAFFICVSATAVLIMSRSSTSLILVAVGVPLSIVLRLITKSKAPQLAIISYVLFSLMVIYIFGQMAPDMSGLLGRDATFTGRSDIWGEVLTYCFERPIFGYGNNFWASDSNLRHEIWRNLGWSAPHAHNAYIDIWFQTGLVGIFIFTASIISTIYLSIKLILFRAHVIELIWPCIVIVLLIRGLSETQFVEPAANTWFTLTLSMGRMSVVLERMQYQARALGLKREGQAEAPRKRRRQVLASEPKSFLPKEFSQ